MKKILMGMLCIGTAGMIAAADRHLKKKSEQGRLRKKHPENFGPICFRNSHNGGAFLRMGEKAPLAVMALSALWTILCGGLLILSLGQAGNNLLRLGLTLLLGGAFSNTYDRLKNRYVTDYFSFRFGPKAFRNIVFNMADFAILTGAMLTAAGAGR